MRSDAKALTHRLPARQTLAEVAADLDQIKTLMDWAKVEMSYYRQHLLLLHQLSAQIAADRQHFQSLSGTSSAPRTAWLWEPIPWWSAYQEPAVTAGITSIREEPGEAAVEVAQ